MPSDAAKALWAKIPDDEPVFIVRGQDKLATGVVEKWINDAQVVDVVQAKIQAATDDLVEISRFQAFNPGRVKFPD